MNKDSIDVLNQIVPELAQLLAERYRLLKMIEQYAPIGRRALYNKLSLTERKIRSSAVMLKTQGLLVMKPEGMSLTAAGYRLLRKLDHYYEGTPMLSAKQKLLCKKLAVQAVEIVPSYQDDARILRDIGERTVGQIEAMLPYIKTLGITGGSTTAAVVAAFENRAINNSQLIVVPARGGIGSQTRYQANALAEKLAKHLGAKRQSLYIPDSLSPATTQQLRCEPTLTDTLHAIDQIDTLIFGVGSAKNLAQQRGLSSGRIADIIKKGAVAEAFGYYMTISGEIVDEVHTLGIALEKIYNLERLIAVAKGKDKAKAIKAVSHLNSNMIIITDDAAADEILKLN